MDETTPEEIFPKCLDRCCHWRRLEDHPWTRHWATG